MQPLATTTSADSVIRCAHELLDTAPTLIRYIRLHMRRHRKGLSVPQFRTLCKVREQPAASLSAVAEHLSASLPTTSRIVTTLVTRGFLARYNCAEDRRQVALHLTPRGRAILDAAYAATHAQMESQLTNLSIQDCNAICHAMCVLRSLLNPAEKPPFAPSPDNSLNAAPPRRRRSKRSLSSVTLDSTPRG